MNLEGFEGIRGTRWCEPARRRSPLHRSLIADDQGNQAPTESTSCARSNASSLRDRRVAMGWAPIRYHPDGNGAPASSARNWRRKRLRTTAGPMARPSAYATLGGVAAGSGMYVHHSTPARVRRPSRAKRVNALRSRMRQIKPTDCAGPWRDVPSARLARRGCSSGGGSRASWRGDDCSVGRCASRNPPRLRTSVSSTFDGK